MKSLEARDLAYWTTLLGGGWMISQAGLDSVKSVGPKRLQRSRKQGSKLPPGVVCVTRPGKFGNPFETAAQFRIWLDRLLDGGPLPALDSPETEKMKVIADNIEQLRGKDLACWCPIGGKHECHADVLIEYANK